MRRLPLSLLVFAAAAFALGGCGDGGDTPTDSGTDAGGDGGNVECVVANDCNDDNLCTDDFCQAGQCVYTNNTAACDDGQTCSVNDHCQDGICVGESSMNCDDDNPCTTDSCDDLQGCVHTNNTVACDDDDPCTLGDVCADGTCSGTPKDCSQVADACNTGECEAGTGSCRQQPVANGTACDDMQECSTDDRCMNGVCVGDTTLDCDDQNPCTEDSCDDTLGCVHAHNHAPCDDSNACTANDMCDQGVCTGGSPLDCDDANDCTTDSCDAATGCDNVNNTDPCSDDNACTLNDVCANGSCQPGAAVDCDDGNACTDDSCDTVLGCVQANNDAPCDDGDACTEGDACAGGQCQPGGSQFDCDDGNVCTDDSCDPVDGCEYVPNSADCDDSDACTMGDTCANGLCQGLPLDADGDNYIAVGCPGGDDCNDGDANVNPGVFEGPSNNNCGDSIDNDCDGDTDLDDVTCGVCNDDSDCDDNNICTGVETCQAGACVGGTSLDCDDGNICTTDTCDAVAGCQYADNASACDDNDPCTLGDQCSGGTCQAGSGTLDCDDGEDCTDDSCVAGTGCANTPDDTNACTDGDPCTDGDQCTGGTCSPGSGTLDCDDSEDCTDDTCVAGTGCQNTPNDSNPCDDGDTCTDTDHCSGGVCVGNTLVCDDSNTCTDDDCVSGTGCVYTPDDTNTCDDGDTCTENDRCSTGACVGDIRDRDSDTYRDKLCGGDDCDDLDAMVNPGAPEVCWDSIDNDCDELTDENCASCASVDPAAELIIDNDVPRYILDLKADEEALNLFFAEAGGYNVLEIQAAFYDASGGSGSGQGNYQAIVYAADADTGLPGLELGSSSIDTVSVTWPDNWHTFTLTSPVALAQGQSFWVAIHSHQDQSTNLFVPLLDEGTLDPYVFGVAYFEPTGQPLDYYSIGGNFLLRVQGCAEGPWLTLTDHTHTPAIVPAGGSTTISTTLRNKGFDTTAVVDGVLSIDDTALTVTANAAAYGTIGVGASGVNSPTYGVSTAANAYGIYGMSLAATDGPNTWLEGFGLYVQGSGCTTDNFTMVTDSDVFVIFPQDVNDLSGNYFVVPSTSYNITSVDVTFGNSHATSAQSGDFRIHVTTYLAGKPDQTIFTSGWQNVSAAAQSTTTATFNISPALTFAEGNTFWVMVENQANQADLGLVADNGLGWMNGVYYDDSEGTWIPIHAYGVGNESLGSWLIRPHGCQATELRYDSHTTSPASVNPGTTASITVTLANDGAVDATNVSAVMTSADSDVTVNTGSANYGTVTASSTAASQTPYSVTVSSGADDFQYLLDLEITDGTNTWNDVVPLRLAGGQVDLAFSEFTTSLAGNDIHYHFVVTNQGNVDAITPFQVDLYIDEENPPAAQQPGDWSDTLSSLGVGQSMPYDLVLSDVTAGTYDAYVQCDTLEAVAESNEGNNVDGPSTQTVGTTDVFELLDPARKWFPADMPVLYRFVSGNNQPGMTQTDARNAVALGLQAWEDVSTATITFNTESQTTTAGFVYDYHNTMTFDDPGGELSSGALAATIPIYTSGQSMVTNGVTFYRMVDADIVFNDGVPYGTNAEAAACGTSVFDMQGTACHEQGHLLGLGHTPVFDATMYYAIGPCDPSSATLEISDINGVTFIYP